MVQEIVITYETLFELLKRERERPDLQKLEVTFFADVISYIRDKKKILEAKNDPAFGIEERKKTERQLENIYKIVKEIYERREKKIINLAMDKSRTKSNLIDTTGLLNEEKVVLEALASLLDTYRDAILLSVLNEKMPFMQNIAEKRYNSPKPEVSQFHRQNAPENGAEDHFKPASEMKKTTKMVRFTSSVPKFVGPELEEYGPFEIEDIANFPSEIADVLISRGKSEEIIEE